MANFNYKGRTRVGKPISGIIEADTREEATNLLRQKGIAVISLSASVDKDDIIRKIEEALHINQLKVTDLILFCRQMHSLTKAGVPIIQSIKAVAGNIKNSHLEYALEQIISGMESGTSLQKCMARFPKVFPEVMIALVGVGENTGNLDEIFAQLAQHFEREEKTKKQVMSAFRYPIFVVIVLCIAIAIVNVMVIPAFAGFFDKFGAELPLPTKILIGVSNFTVENGYLIILGAVALIIWWISFIRTKIGRLYWDTKKLKLPLIGGIFTKAILSRFARSFALSSRAGVPLLEGISLIATSTDNAFVNKKVLEIRGLIERGESLTVAAEKIKLFTTLVMQMLSIGEQTGELDRLLDEVADFYEEELDYELAKLSSAIEPILISIVAAMVLVLALGIFLPMWDISSAAIS